MVDDDHSNNFLNKIFIDHLGLNIEVDITLNGKEALEHIHHNLITPCLIILDIKMPVMDGWDFLDSYEHMVPEHVKEQIVIVMITISKEEEDMVMARKNPYVAEYIQKPLSDIKFSNLIKRHFTW